MIGISLPRLNLVKRSTFTPRPILRALDTPRALRPVQISARPSLASLAPAKRKRRAR